MHTSTPWTEESRSRSPDWRTTRTRSDGVRTGARLPSVVYKVDLASGHKAARKDWTPADPAGITFAAVRLAHDGQSYVYSCSRFLSDLYLVEGLR